MSARASTALPFGVFPAVTGPPFVASSAARLPAFAPADGFACLRVFTSDFAALACGIVLQLPQMSARLFRALVDVRSDGAATERIAQLSPEKATGRVAGSAGVKSIGKIAHHGRVFVNYVGKNFEIVVVDD